VLRRYSRQHGITQIRTSASDEVVPGFCVILDETRAKKNQDPDAPEKRSRIQQFAMHTAERSFNEPKKA
jgi:hypothetical protein